MWLGQVPESMWKVWLVYMLNIMRLHGRLKDTNWYVYKYMIRCGTDRTVKMCLMYIREWYDIVIMIESIWNMYKCYEYDVIREMNVLQMMWTVRVAWTLVIWNVDRDICGKTCNWHDYEQVLIITCVTRCIVNDMTVHAIWITRWQTVKPDMNRLTWLIVALHTT